MSMFLTVAALVVVFGLMILAVPVDCVFDIRYGSTSRTKITFRWLFGAVEIPLKTREKGKRGLRTRRAKRPGNRRRMLTFVRNGKFRHRVLGFARRLFQAAHIKTLDVRIRLGLDDPADTGQLCGALFAVNACLADLARANVLIEPDFADEVFDLDGHGWIRVVPLEIAVVSIVFLLSPSVIRSLVSSS